MANGLTTSSVQGQDEIWQAKHPNIWDKQMRLGGGEINLLAPALLTPVHCNLAHSKGSSWAVGNTLKLMN